MAMITDPDYLNDGTEIQIDADAHTVRLSATGNLSTDGVTIKCVYSKLKELWKSDTTYIKYPFPMTPITDEQFEMVNTWDWYDDTTRYLLRTGGWAVKDSSGNSTSEWAGVIGLGSLGVTDQVYFQQGAAGAAGSATADFELQGQVNQAICVYTSGGNDFRSYLKLFCRTWGKTYAKSELSDIGVDTLTYQAYRFPLTNASDPKVTEPASAMSAAPYTDISITWYTSAESRTIGSSACDFHAIIEGSDEDAETIYQAVQWALLQDSDIDAGAGIQVGKTASPLLRFVGDTLYTMFYTITPTGGTFIDNFATADINRLIFVDDWEHEQQYPYTAVLTINFGDNLVNDAEAKYWAYFTDVPSGDYGDDDAILVDTADAVATIARYRNSNSVSLTAAEAHGCSAGDGIVVADLGGSGYNGTWIVASTPSATILTYACTAGDEAYTADTGGTITPNMSGKVNGESSIQKTFDYDLNTQGGRTQATNAPITVVAIGLASAQFVKTTGTITRSITNSVSLVAPLERNYQNPA